MNRALKKLLQETFFCYKYGKEIRKDIHKMRSILLYTMFIMVITLVTGCNTVEGVGRDIEKAGESIQKL